MSYISTGACKCFTVNISVFSDLCSASLFCIPLYSIFDFWTMALLESVLLDVDLPHVVLVSLFLYCFLSPLSGCVVFPL